MIIHFKIPTFTNCVYVAKTPQYKLKELWCFCFIGLFCELIFSRDDFRCVFWNLNWTHVSKPAKKRSLYWANDVQIWHSPCHSLVCAPCICTTVRRGIPCLQIIGSVQVTASWWAWCWFGVESKHVKLMLNAFLKTYVMITFASIFFFLLFSGLTK